MTVIDDDDDGRDELMDDLRDCGYEPIAITGEFGHDLDRLIREIEAARATFVICDHRLQRGGLASFFGADVVEGLARRHVPAMLLTMFQSPSQLDIRAHRHAVPVVVPRDEFRPELVPQYAEVSLREISDDPVEERKPHRVLIRIEDVHRGTHGTRIDVVIPSWAHDHAVVIPNECIDPAIVARLQPGLRLLGDVNIGAEREADLFFSNVNELAPPPKDL